MNTKAVVCFLSLDKNARSIKCTLLLWYLIGFATIRSVRFIAQLRLCIFY